VSLAAALAPGSIPEQSTRAFTDAINQGDLRAAAHCFALDACLTTPDATTIRGRDEIRPIIAQLIARGSRIEVQARSILVAGEVALASERWAIRSAGAEGAVFEQRSSPTLVLRLVEGAWKLAIAPLWGLRAVA
jgi:ketosteroid isomerase-like protein